MQNKNKLVSIVLNCFNGEEFLKAALSSIINQTYENWELIFWDNKSTDRSKIIFDKFKSKKFKYFKSKKHVPLYKAKNLAIKKCRGEYITFIDSDDTWDKDKLKKQIKLFSNKKIGVVYGNMWIRNENNNKSKIYWKTNLPDGFIYNDLIKNYCIGIISTMIRKKILNFKKKIFNEKYNHIGDFDLFTMLSKKWKFGVVQSPVATYRVHGNNLSFKNRKNEIKEFKHWLNKNSKYLKDFEKKIIEQKIEQKCFIDIRLEGHFLSTVRFFLKSKYIKYKFKNLVLLILPIILLKKIMWYV